MHPTLWRRAKRGDLKAADELLEVTYRPVYGYLRKLCRNQEEAEDLTQETFARLWVTLPEDRFIRNFKAWVYRIAYNVYVDARRKSKPTETRPDEWWNAVPSEGTNHTVLVADRDLSRRLWKMVEDLSDDTRQAVYLHYHEGLSLRETAQVLSVATSTVKHRLRKAIEFLRERLSEQETPTKSKLAPGEQKEQPS